MVLRWSEIREIVIDRAEHACEFCGKPEEKQRDQSNSPLEVHHIIPRGHGGSDAPSNLLALCTSCHVTMSNWNKDTLPRSGNDLPYWLFQFTRFWNHRRAGLIEANQQHEYLMAHDLPDHSSCDDWRDSLKQTEAQLREWGHDLGE